MAGRLASPEATGRRRIRRSERGAAATELTLLVPALMLILGLMVAGARIWFARASLTVAAEAGARAASLERNPGAAQGAAESAVRWNLDASEVRCAPLIVGVDATILGTSAGRAGLVTTTLQCRLSLRDVALPGLPGTLDVGADGTAVADTYRSRG